MANWNPWLVFICSRGKAEHVCQQHRAIQNDIAGKHLLPSHFLSFCQVIFYMLFLLSILHLSSLSPGQIHIVLI